MNNFIVYSLEAAASMALFYTAYWVLLKNDTFFKLNRFYLLCSILISLLVPLLNITVGTQQDFIAKNLVMPFEDLRHRMHGESDMAHLRVTDNASVTRHLENTGAWLTDELNTAAAVQADNNATNTAQYNKPAEPVNWLTIALIIYMVGVALLLMRFVANFVWLFANVAKNKPQPMLGMRVIKLQKDVPPFSFLNFIFIGNKPYPEDELQKMIAHEKVHIRQKHSLDLILTELLLAFQWFNPFVWLYKKAIRINHEYLADQGTLNSGVDAEAYQYSLLSQALGRNPVEIASNYNLSIKKRITMMMKKRSSKMAALKLGVALPIALVSLSAFAFTTAPAVAKQVQDTPPPVATTFDSIKRIKVSTEYLHQLEGIYVTADSPKNGRVRRVKFAEVLGKLIGTDNAYVYEIIPVGNGKFINPDDNATFVFNTESKDAVTLVMFDKEHLQKINASTEFNRESAAFSTIKVMDKEGVEAGLAHFKQVRDSEKYYLTENEMNYAGYMMLKNNKPKEAAAVFKLNTQIYPNSFNVYDSYGEALLALGDKQLAITNYVKSLYLNPGNKYGLKQLVALGVNTDTMHNTIQVSDEYLKMLAGDYVSTNYPTPRKIKYSIEKGMLTGDDNGYHYKLVPVAEGKFINPDDGATLVFDTKNKDEITALLFGSMKLKKLKAGEKAAEPAPIKKVAVSVDYLRMVQGEYVSTNANSRVRKIRFEELNGELVGNDNGYVYKVIPVGDGKFINPDDGASLVFNTSDKNSITAVLFGTLNLTKVK